MDYNMQPILDAIAPLAEVGNVRGHDPGESPADDAPDEACGFIAYAAQTATAGFPSVTVDDECTAEREGNFVTFDMPRYRVKVPWNVDAELMAKWAADEHYLAVAAMQRGLK